MIETDIRIVNFGDNLRLDTRVARLIGQDISPDLKQKACQELKRKGLASIPCPEGILVAGTRPIQSTVISEDDWRIEIRDKDVTKRLHFSKPDEADMIAQLLERCLLIEISKRTDLWTLDSTRIFYAPIPFKEVDGIAAYRRYEISSISIEEVGIGLVVDISTAFFTVPSVADFFEDLSPDKKWQPKRFEALSRRQTGQKATLLYDLGRNKVKCYFDEFSDTTCATTGILRVKGKDYRSLYEYYQQTNPNLNVNPNDSVAKVSFPGINHPCPVVANRLYLRVMNDVVPAQLKQVDKISPEKRCTLIEKFWMDLGNHPLGSDKPSIANSFWQPQKQLLPIKPPSLKFAKGKGLSSKNGTSNSSSEYYRRRSSLLHQVGCLSIPPAMSRNIHIRVPNTVEQAAVDRLAKDLTDYLSRWTSKKITFDLETYKSVDNALLSLQQEPRSGIVVFVFEDEDPATYFKVSSELTGWRVKRITSGTLIDHFGRLSRDERILSYNDSRQLRGVRNWRSFVEMSALDVLQQMDCVPWGLADPLHYEAQLAIDVGWDRRYFALSLFICRPESMRPSFSLNTLVLPKPDTKHETINEIVLKDSILKLFQQVKQRHFVPLRSILIIRDGRGCGRELDSIAQAKDELIQSRFLEESGRVDTVDFHKRSVKRIRMWFKDHAGQISNVPEGTAFAIDSKTVVLANTGAATLPQGTAEPVMLVAHRDDIDIFAIAQDVHSATQLNWSNPRVAQRLPIALKRTDEELTNRAGQEIRRIK